MTISKELRNLVTKFFKDGKSKTEISKQLNISERSVYRILSESGHSKPASKRQKNIKVRSDCIYRGFKSVRTQGKLITSTRIKSKIPISLSVSTIRRYMLKLGMKYRPAVKKIMLSEKHKETRVNIVRKWICHKVDPDLIVFTDECRFSLDGNDALYTWKDKNNVYLPKRPFGGGSLMVWGAICKSGKIIIRRIKGKLNSDAYCQLMDKDILPILNSTIRTYILQQDNAPCHVSAKSKAMFAKNNVILLPWPPKSPDLSPIEHLWGILKRKLYDGTLYSNLDELWQRINYEVLKLEIECSSLIPNLWSNYCVKMCDILCNKGELLK